MDKQQSIGEWKCVLNRALGEDGLQYLTKREIRKGPEYA
jgi:hypothetical protein